MFANDYPSVRKHPDTEEGRRQAANELLKVVQGLMHGKMNLRGELTLTAGVTTTVQHSSFHSGTIFLMMPANAAAAAITWHVSNRTDAEGGGTITITTSTAAGTETFEWVAFG